MIKIGIICGCLPSQYGIESSDLYHQVLSRKLEQEMNQQVDIASVWYTTLADSYPNSVRMIETKGPDIVFYHVRPDPYLRLSKLRLRYLDKSGLVLSKWNFNAEDGMIIDRDDNVERSPLRKKSGSMRRLVRLLNYGAGYLMGSNAAAIRKEELVIGALVRYADEKALPLLIIGPASRPRSLAENRLLFKLEKRLKTRFGRNNYVSCFGSQDEQGNALFMEDGVHVNKKGHFRFSELIFPVLKKILIKQSVY